MKTLQQLCTPRPGIFDPSRRDTVLDVTDLIDRRISPEEFFIENFVTDGMARLLREAFRRFAGKSTQGVFVLTQAMGGGKTHNMIALGLLARHPHLRSQVMGDAYEEKDLGEVRVVGFTGRETSAPYGIWGAIADQLGKKEVFNNFYSPLSAPGPTDWIRLLQGEPKLILLDELPPYFEHAKAKTIGDTNLAHVTTAALANLLVAVAKAELDNVCVVISDLRATYEEGGAHLLKALANFEDEVHRMALRLEPVGMNTDDVYHILRKRLFEKLPSEIEVAAVAEAYAKAVRDARQMDITKASPEQFAAQIRSSYPFHFTIRDLYARFRENPGFQQTRGLIRLMRVLVSRLYETKRADQIHLVHPYDLDLNHQETLAEITAINPTLDNAIAHDIASNGGAVAEIMDANLGGGNDTQDVGKLLLVASLANVPNAVLGLSESEIVSSLCAPGRDVSQLQKNVFERFFTSAWYLWTSSDGKLFFKNLKNLVADLKTRADSYNREACLRELRSFLAGIFQPVMKDCYQEVLALPAIDQIQIKPEKVTLVICEPFEREGLSPDLQKFYADLDYQNRILFLTGQYQTLEHLLERAAELKAIGSILKEMDDEKYPENDPQRLKAIELQDRIMFQLLSAARETFTTLVFPHMNQLRTGDFLMSFTDNNYNGEKQIREALKSKQKFTDDIESEAFRKKCEDRLFTQKTMLWSEIRKRSATNTAWPWHRPDALDRLKERMVHANQWRETDGWVEKPPFPPPETGVRIRPLSRNDDTGEVVLRLNPVHGDLICFEVGKEASPESSRVEDPENFSTAELKVSFLCVDSSGRHQTGPAEEWRNKITLKSRVYQGRDGAEKRVELRAAPPAPIRYTIDGSSPLDKGASYTEPFPVGKNTFLVLAVAEKDGLISEVHRREIPWDRDEPEFDPTKPATWRREHKFDTTMESYDFLDRLQKHQAMACGPRLMVTGSKWLDFAVHPDFQLDGEQMRQAVEYLRRLLPDGQVGVTVPRLWFPLGQHLLDWAAEAKTDLKAGEVEQ